MRRQTGFGVIVMACIVGLTMLGVHAQPTTVGSIDLQRYMGLWYAIASIPTSFEKQCIQGTTAEYTLLENGKVQVVNTCLDAAGNPDVARGRAWVPNPDRPTELKVSFVRFLGFWFFPGAYWVIELGEDYEYAVVGHPTYRYGWILSRTPTLSDDVFAEIVAKVEAQGYDFSTFRIIDQSIHNQE